VKLPDGFYAIGDFEKERLRIRYIAAPGSLPNQSADELQTICNPVLGLFSIKMRTFTGGNIVFD
jgi:hypothetical protein